ncbi:MAG: hypothetical protein ABII12_01650 [Planctomycetota bacterium]
MMKRLILVACCAVLGGCGLMPFVGTGATTFAVPMAATTPVPGGILIGIPTLEGEWVIADDEGGRFCLTIQESRVSIINVGCTSDGQGFAARIRESPQAIIAGPNLVITAIYNPRFFETTLARLTFSGVLQPDGTYAGQLQTEVLEAEDAPVSRPAILGRI